MDPGRGTDLDPDVVGSLTSAVAFVGSSRPGASVGFPTRSAPTDRENVQRAGSWAERLRAALRVRAVDRWASGSGVRFDASVGFLGGFVEPVGSRPWSVHRRLDKRFRCIDEDQPVVAFLRAWSDPFDRVGERPWSRVGVADLVAWIRVDAGHLGACPGACSDPFVAADLA